MKKPDGFSLTIGTILLALGLVYYHLATSPSYVENDPVLSAMVERRLSIQKLQHKLQSIEGATARQSGEAAAGARRTPASVRPGSRLQDEFEVESGGADDAAAVAEHEYRQAKISCYKPGAELECINQIDRIVTHFPESRWAAESLVLLTDYYYRTKRLPQARELVRILKEDFRHLPEIQEKVVIIEKVIR